MTWAVTETHSSGYWPSHACGSVSVTAADQARRPSAPLIVRHVRLVPDGPQTALPGVHRARQGLGNRPQGGLRHAGNHPTATL